jgi:hypothetical protein
MPTSDARISMNPQNARLSDDSAEVERRFKAFVEELQPSGVVALTLVRRAATLSIRMEKCSEREIATTSERMARAMADCEVPEGVDATEAARLRLEAGRLAAFDPSKEAILARRYEADAERGFFRALKELRHVEKQARVIDQGGEVERFQQELGSFLEMSKLDEQFEVKYPEPGCSNLKKPFDPFDPKYLGSPQKGFDVPFSIGRAR